MIAALRTLHVVLGVAAPHPFFTVLMAVELALPMVFLALWRAARR